MVNKYLNSLAKELSTGIALEHSYRPALKELIESLGPSIKAVNDPQRSEYGAPDFAFVDKKNKGVVLGYAETKDLGSNLDSVESSDQLQRYLGYSKLILTNYLEFRFFSNGNKYQTIKVGDASGSKIVNIKNTDVLERELKAFLTSKPESIKEAKKLSEIMGAKARRIRDNVEIFLDSEEKRSNELEKAYKMIKKVLVKDLDHSKFADMYAQTLVYGLFMARYYDETPEDFTRREARDLIPKSTPFLRQFFNHILGPDFDERLEYIVNELCEVFACSDVHDLMNEYMQDSFLGDTNERSDNAVIHFYEDFLKEYDPDLRRKMGAYYTPLPVVKFIVRATDDLLRSEFNLSRGLGDTSKLEGKTHRVQILDPAVGTGTFISAVIRRIYIDIKKKGQEGRWTSYVHNELLPRLHGFEIMMAPYTIAHLRLTMAFKETGFIYFNRRLGIYLTNSLEKPSPQRNLLADLGFAGSIAKESKEAAIVKNKTPIMVVLGNPPYSVSSSNKGEWISNLIEDYKKNLGEKKINLDDDYIKFIKLAEHFIEKNESGIVAMITNHSFLYGITHRQMRKHLLETFDKIYILDLHGDVKKKETTPSGGKDENVFDIQQGVSINIFVSKEKKKKKLAKVYHADLFGLRKEKFSYLSSKRVDNVEWKKLSCSDPYFFFVPKDFSLENEYTKGFSIKDLFIKNVTNIVTSRDSIAIAFNKESLVDRLESLIDGSSPLELKDTRDWDAQEGLEKLKKDEDFIRKIKPILYRPFDLRYIFYTDYFLDWPRMELMPNLLKPNIALVSTRQVTGEGFNHIIVTKWITEYKLGSHDRNSYTFPLYLYKKDGSRTVNLDKEIVEKIEEGVGKISPEDVLDYIYAVLHSSRYRERYKEFLKIDFPRIPYPPNKKVFKNLVSLGKRLRLLHLFESSDFENMNVTYPVPGSNKVAKRKYENERVYINKEQYFGNVPNEIWNFYIGGYQPAQKWLKDRKGRKLTSKDIVHYQKIIVAISRTIELMKKINGVNFIQTSK